VVVFCPFRRGAPYTCAVGQVIECRLASPNVLAERAAFGHLASDDVTFLPNKRDLQYKCPMKIAAMKFHSIVAIRSIQPDLEVFCGASGSELALQNHDLKSLRQVTVCPDGMLALFLANREGTVERGCGEDRCREEVPMTERRRPVGPTRTSKLVHGVGYPTALSPVDESAFDQLACLRLRYVPLLRREGCIEWLRQRSGDRAGFRLDNYPGRRR
jgi:hypothetical protein